MLASPTDGGLGNSTMRDRLPLPQSETSLLVEAPRPNLSVDTPSSSMTTVPLGFTAAVSPPLTLG